MWVYADAPPSLPPTPSLQEPSNVVLARISDGLFPVTLDALYTLFSFYGTVQKVRPSCPSSHAHASAHSLHLKNGKDTGLAAERRLCGRTRLHVPGRS